MPGSDAADLSTSHGKPFSSLAQGTQRHPLGSMITIEGVRQYCRARFARFGAKTQIIGTKWQN